MISDLLKTYWFALFASLFSSANSAATINHSGFSVSGLSSGGYMATQFQLVYSNEVSAALIIAGGPYLCSEGSLQTALGQCLTADADGARTEALSAQAADLAKAGRIGPIEALQRHQVMVVHGENDQRVSRGVVENLLQQYRQWVPQSQILTVVDQPFAHVFPTLDEGNDCGVSAPPFIGNCGYDTAGRFFMHAFGEPKKPVPQQAAGSLYRFDQRQSALEPDAFSRSGLADSGFIYVPPQCNDNKNCRLHISFHGCKQNSAAVGTQYAEKTGLNRWADAYDTVILYPQITASMLNPMACWDWWGYSSEQFAMRDGLQIQSVFRLAERAREGSLVMKPLVD